MAAVPFDVSSGSDTQDSTGITLASGESARVRFTTYSGGADTYFGITRNSVTTYSPICVGDIDGADTRTEKYSTAYPGDTVFLRVKLNGAGSAVAGILESLA